MERDDSTYDEILNQLEGEISPSGSEPSIGSHKDPEVAVSESLGAIGLGSVEAENAPLIALKFAVQQLYDFLGRRLPDIEKSHQESAEAVQQLERDTRQYLKDNVGGQFALAPLSDSKNLPEGHMGKNKLTGLRNIQAAHKFAEKNLDVLRSNFARLRVLLGQQFTPEQIPSLISELSAIWRSTWEYGQERDPETKKTLRPDSMVKSGEVLKLLFGFFDYFRRKYNK